jgi:hypothetical protein
MGNTRHDLIDRVRPAPGARVIATLAIAVGAAACLGSGAAGWRLRALRSSPAAKHAATGTRRILLPFAGTSISRRSLEAAVRLARAEGATIMPTYLARVPRHLPLDAPLALQCLSVMPLLEAIEQRVLAQGVAVDARVSRGRTYRDALRHQLALESVDRIVISATTDERSGLNGADLQWLLSQVPAEVLILRAGFEDHRVVTSKELEGHS